MREPTRSTRDMYRNIPMVAVSIQSTAVALLVPIAAPTKKPTIAARLCRKLSRKAVCHFIPVESRMAKSPEGEWNAEGGIIWGYTCILCAKLCTQWKGVNTSCAICTRVRVVLSQLYEGVRVTQQPSNKLGVEVQNSTMTTTL